MIQVDSYIKAFSDEQVLPVLAAIDVETGVAMAVRVQDKHKQVDYLVKCLQTLLF